VSVGVNTCELLPGWGEILWDPRSSASSYATLSALLAGFSLSGLLWISSGSKELRLQRSSGVLGIWASLVPLLLATLMFSEIQGDSECDQAAAETSVALLLMVVGTVTVFASLGAMLTRVFDDSADRLARVVSWTAVWLGAAGVYAGNSTVRTLVDGEVWEGTAEGRVQAGVMIVAMIVVASWKAPLKSANALVYTVVIGSAIYYLVFYFIAFERPMDWITGTLTWARTLYWCIFAFTIAGLIRLPASDA
jgi:uncharacterized membrane protein YiaA